MTIAGTGAGVALAGCSPTSHAGPVTIPSCGPPLGAGAGPMPLPGSPGLIDEVLFGARVDEYLALCTDHLSPGSPANVLAHLTRARRDPTHTWNASAVSNLIAPSDTFLDTSDFTLMYLQWVLREGRGVLPASVISSIEDAIAGTRYRYDDPLPDGVVDGKWFWSENHRIIFAVDEYLGGLALPDRVFSVTGLTGAQHAERALPRIHQWIDERARYGFSEWHSNVYLKFDFMPLLTLVEYAPDEDLRRLGAAMLDVVLFDIAAHLRDGALGVTHGRTYKKDKMSSLDDTCFNTAKLLFDSTDRNWTGADDFGAVGFAAATVYRLPEVIRRVANSTEVSIVRERHGVELDPHEAFSLNPEAPDGHRYDLVDELPFWWAQGALTSWQVIPVTMAAAKKWNLFDTPLFSQYNAIKPFLDVPPALAQSVARELAPFVAAGVLGEAHTYTWRSPDAMLSSVIDHRFGDAMEQSHAWQATLDPEALVFTTHPSNPTPKSLDWREDSGYWTGTASMPRSAQRGRAAIHIYRPGYVSPTDPLLGPLFGYEPYTHAFFPQDRFDEVTNIGHWWCGRKANGYVALWSERPTEWRSYDTATEATGGHTLPFDLIAAGGADNVWVCEVGRAADHGNFAAFVAAVAAAPPVVIHDGGTDSTLVSVTYASPTEGTLAFSTRGGFSVDGIEAPLRDHPRHSSPWAEQCAEGPWFDIRDGQSRLVLDLAAGTRTAS